MSIYLDLLKSKIGYTERQYHVSDSIPLSINPAQMSIDITTSIATDHRSLGQVVALEGNNNAPSDKFSSVELHEKSKEALSDLKRFFETGH